MDTALAMDMQQLARAKDVMRQRFGFDAFLPEQEKILSRVFAGENLLVILPTGGGKSLLFQLPPLVDNAMMIVISPLIALMREQVERLQKQGIAAGALHSANEDEDDAATLDALRIRRLRLLYLSPERFVMPGMQALLAHAKPRYIAIDEAHCVSHWGHDFRPDYLRLKSVIRALKIPQIMAFTATADMHTRADITTQLFDTPPRAIIASFARPNIFLAVKRKRAPMLQLTRALEAYRGQGGIIYCNTRRNTEELAHALAYLGYKALPYHAGLPHFVRTANQEQFLQKPDTIMVATIAFGMGIDRPDVRFVFHADAPTSLESFYQEIGRAGRDGLPAKSILFYDKNAFAFQRTRLREEKLPAEDLSRALFRLQALEDYCCRWRCRRQMVLACFGEESQACGACDICVKTAPLRYVSHAFLKREKN